MPQLFARPPTPNDNPFVESCFGTLKTAPQYPGRFVDDEEAIEYFTRYFSYCMIMSIAIQASIMSPLSSVIGG